MGFVFFSCDNAVVNDKILGSIETDTYMILNSEINEIQLSNGATLEIPSDIFQTNIEDSIEILVKEVNKASEAIIENLNTMSLSGILETEQMIRIIAKQAGEELELKEDCNIQYHSSDNSDLSNYRMFYGQEIDDKFIWEVDSMTKYCLSIYFNYSTNCPCYNCDCSELISITHDTLFWSKEEIKIDSFIVYGLSRDTVVYDNSSFLLAELNQINPWIDSYVIPIRKLGWFNVDRYLDIETVSARIILDDIYDKVQCFIVLDNYKSIIRPSSIDKKEVKFDIAPKNESIAIITIAQKGKKTYYNSIIRKGLTSESIEAKLNETPILEIGELIQEYDQ